LHSALRWRQREDSSDRYSRRRFLRYFASVVEITSRRPIQSNSIQSTNLNKSQQIITLPTSSHRRHRQPYTLLLTRQKQHNQLIPNQIKKKPARVIVMYPIHRCRPTATKRVGGHFIPERRWIAKRQRSAVRIEVKRRRREGRKGGRRGRRKVRLAPRGGARLVIYMT
jgi:hypothetical protein